MKHKAGVEIYTKIYFLCSDNPSEKFIKCVVLCLLTKIIEIPTIYEAVFSWIGRGAPTPEQLIYVARMQRREGDYLKLLIRIRIFNGNLIWFCFYCLRLADMSRKHSQEN
jgi:hypothetical protein